MAMYTVLFTPSSRWMVGISPTEQVQWKEHQAFINQLAEGNRVIIGGLYTQFPKILMVIEAEDQNHVLNIFANDPFVQHDIMMIDQINETMLYVSCSLSLSV